MTVRHRSISTEWQNNPWKQLRKLNTEFMVLMPEQTQRRKKKTSKKTPLHLNQQTKNQKNPKTNKIQLLEAIYLHFSWQKGKVTVLFFNLYCMFVHTKHNAICMGNDITMWLGSIFSGRCKCLNRVLHCELGSYFKFI